jgi:hypothetical protein
MQRKPHTNENKTYKIQKNIEPTKQIYTYKRPKRKIKNKKSLLLPINLYPNSSLLVNSPMKYSNME